MTSPAKLAGQVRYAVLGKCGFHIFCILAVTGRPVVLGALVKKLLRGRRIGSLPLPGFKHGSLQRPAIGEAQLPWMLTHGVHGIEVFRRHSRRGE